MMNSAINFTDNQVNSPELGILEREIKQVKRGCYGDDKAGAFDGHVPPLYNYGPIDSRER
jgi:hypothetical protein